MYQAVSSVSFSAFGGSDLTDHFSWCKITSGFVRGDSSDFHQSLDSVFPSISFNTLFLSNRGRLCHCLYFEALHRCGIFINFNQLERIQ